MEGLLQLRTEHQPHDRGEVDPGEGWVGVGTQSTFVTPGEEQGLHERQESRQGVRGRH